MILNNVNKTRGLLLKLHNILPRSVLLRKLHNILPRSVLLRKLHNILPRSVLLTTYKDFVRPYLAYGNIIDDQVYNATFHQKLELIQYNPCLALTWAIRGTSKEKFYEELGLESLQHCRLYRKLSNFYKFYKNEFPQYLFKLIPVRCSEYSNRTMQNISFFKTRHNIFKKMFFLSAIIQWNNLDLNIRNQTSLNIFKNSILKFIRPSASNVFNNHNSKAINFITRLMLVLSHLPERKFKHSLQHLLNPNLT